jgi:CDP-glucose 4,6-dehydratase
LALDKRLWAGKRVLVTGHTGFKGAWLSVFLNELGAHVYGFSLDLEASNRLFMDAGISELLSGQRLGDIRNYQVLSEYIEEIQPEYVFHLAAQSLVLKSFNDPLETISTNIVGSSNLLIAALRNPSVKLIVNVTTDKVYVNDNSKLSFTEKDVLGGDDIYSGSKAAVEILSRSINSSLNEYGKKIVNVRAGNVIGGGDWAQDRLIPDIIKSVISSEIVTIRNPLSTRPWQYILDCLNGYLLVVQKNIGNENFIFPDALNFGPPDSLSVQNVVDIFSKVMDLKFETAPEPGSVMEKKYLSLNSNLAVETLGWKPQFSAQKAVEKTANWYQSYLAGENPRLLIEKEISGFLEATV